MNGAQGEQKEDYFVQATLNIAGEEVRDVPCKIFLPDRITDKPIMKFKPSEEQYKKIIASHEGSFKAEVIGFNKQKEVSIVSPQVYFSEMKTNRWDLDISESSFKGEPQHLQITRHLEREPSKTLLTLWISPNSMLNPAISQETSFKGDIKYKRVRQLEFTIAEDFKITFDKHFRTTILTNNDLKQWSYLVAISELDIPAHEVDRFRETILPQIEDFLLIASLGSRTRTACIGWEAYDHQKVVTYYRGDFTFPAGTSESSFDRGLVWQNSFSDFVNSCYANYLKYSNKRVIRKAIFAVVPGREKVLEASFLSMFAGLEALILDFRRNKNLEFIVTDMQEWGVLKKEIKMKIREAVKEKLDSEQRSRLYSKLDELNRISLQTAFEKFCAEYNLDLTDLWPVFNTDETFGLSEIRNRLIHGDPLSSECYNALWTAEQNLRYMLERVLIKVLGWPVDETNVSKGFLRKHYTVFKTMTEDQKNMFDYLSSQ